MSQSANLLVKNILQVTMMSKVSQQLCMLNARSSVIPAHPVMLVLDQTIWNHVTVRFRKTDETSVGKSNSR